MKKEKVVEKEGAELMLEWKGLMDG